MNGRWTKLNIFAVVFFAAYVTIGLSSEFLYADDFGRIVHHIEASYHVHRNHRFAMGFAGLVVKFWHVAGVRSFKAAIFEDQHLDGTDTDTKLDEIVAHASRSGWQPMVRSFSRRTGEHTYIYAQDNGAGKDLKLLVVSVEQNEAAVIQVKLDPDKLEQFIEENAHDSDRRGHSAMDGVMTFR
jgi:hypothetical protein